MKPIMPGVELYLVRREPFPEKKSGIVTLTKEDRTDHLYLGVVLETGPVRIDYDKPSEAKVPILKKGEYILYIASAGWKLQNCPHAPLLDIDKENLVFLKEEDIVAVVALDK